MKITKYPQSCVLFETEAARILVDPGYLKLKEHYLTKDWGNLDGILVTHKHPDHCDVEIILQLMQFGTRKLVSCNDVAPLFPGGMVTVVKAGDTVRLNDAKIEIAKAVHGYVPWLKGDKEIKECIGFLISDDHCRAYITGDTICFKNDYKCDVLFLPISNFGVVMGAFEAALFAVETDASLTVPLHYDNPRFPADLDKVEEQFRRCDVNHKIMKIGETITV